MNPDNRNDNVTSIALDLAVAQKLISKAQASQLQILSESTRLSVGDLIVKHNVMPADDWSRLITVSQSRTHGRSSYFGATPSNGVVQDISGHMRSLPEVGDVVSGYRLVEELGRGGMGVVYKAQLGKVTVAIKFLLKLTERNEARFEREIGVLTRLERSSRVVRILGQGAHMNRPYFIMEFVEGQTLKSLIQSQRTINHTRVLLILKQIVEALAVIHKNDIIHRDLKPENIMLRENSDPDDIDVVLMDFGVAKVVDLETLTKSQELLGSLHYIAPEILSSSSKKAGPWTDVWAVGVLLFEMVSGHRPFNAKAAPVLVGQILGQPRRQLPKSLSVPRPILRVIDRCLEKDPTKRYQSCSELLAALDTMKDSPRPRSIWIVVAAVIGVIAITAAVVGYSVIDARQRAAEKIQQRESLIKQIDSQFQSTRDQFIRYFAIQWIREFSGVKAAPEPHKLPDSAREVQKLVQQLNSRFLVDRTPDAESLPLHVQEALSCDLLLLIESKSRENFEAHGLSALDPQAQAAIRFFADVYRRKSNRNQVKLNSEELSQRQNLVLTKLLQLRDALERLNTEPERSLEYLSQNTSALGHSRVVDIFQFRCQAQLFVNNLKFSMIPADDLVNSIIEKLKTDTETQFWRRELKSVVKSNLGSCANQMDSDGYEKLLFGFHLTRVKNPDLPWLFSALECTEIASTLKNRIDKSRGIQRRQYRSLGMLYELYTVCGQRSPKLYLPTLKKLDAFLFDYEQTPQSRPLVDNCDDVVLIEVFNLGFFSRVVQARLVGRFNRSAQRVKLLATRFPDNHDLAAASVVLQVGSIRNNRTAIISALERGRTLLQTPGLKPGTTALVSQFCAAMVYQSGSSLPREFDYLASALKLEYGQLVPDPSGFYLLFVNINHSRIKLKESLSLIRQAEKYLKYATEDTIERPVQGRTAEVSRMAVSPSSRIVMKNQILHMRSSLYFTAGKYDQVVKLYDECLSADPTANLLPFQLMIVESLHKLNKVDAIQLHVDRLKIRGASRPEYQSLLLKTQAYLKRTKIQLKQD